MVVAPFVHAHAGHADWRTALADCLRQLRARGAGAGAAYTLGWSHFTDYCAAAAEAILQELQGAFPGVAWVGTDGIGVSASGVEYFDEPGIALMLAALPAESFCLFSGRRPIGPVREITAAEANFVLALDGRPALDCLLSDLDLDADLSGEELVEALDPSWSGFPANRQTLPMGPASSAAIPRFAT